MSAAHPPQIASQHAQEHDSSRILAEDDVYSPRIMKASLTVAEGVDPIIVTGVQKASYVLALLQFLGAGRAVHFSSKLARRIQDDRFMA